MWLGWPSENGMEEGAGRVAEGRGGEEGGIDEIRVVVGDGGCGLL